MKHHKISKKKHMEIENLLQKGQVSDNDSVVIECFNKAIGIAESIEHLQTRAEVQENIIKYLLDKNLFDLAIQVAESIPVETSKKKGIYHIVYQMAKNRNIDNALILARKYASLKEQLLSMIAEQLLGHVYSYPTVEIRGRSYPVAEYLFEQDEMSPPSQVTLDEIHQAISIVSKMADKERINEIIKMIIYKLINLHEFQQAISLSKQYDGIELACIVESLLQDNRLEQVLEVVQLFPNLAEKNKIYYALLKGFGEHARLDKCSEFLEGIDNDDIKEASYMYLGKKYYELGNIAEALELLEKGTQILFNASHGNNVRKLLNYIEIYAKIDIEKALHFAQFVVPWLENTTALRLRYHIMTEAANFFRNIQLSVSDNIIQQLKCLAETIPNSDPDKGWVIETINKVNYEIMMKEYNGSKFRAIFHSELSSSFILYEIFNNHKNITKEFLNQFLKIEIDHTNIHVRREKNYPGKGAIDVFFSFEYQEKEVHVLLEVKVHDYFSVTKGQIKTYYEAAQEELGIGTIYFIYLTEFTTNNFPKNENIGPPATLQEFEDSQQSLKNENLAHISWEDFHEFIRPFIGDLQEEERLMLELQKSWITAKVEKELKDNAIDIGERDILDYFDDITINLEKVLPGKKTAKNNRLNYIIDTARCSQPELDKIFDVIRQFSLSKKVDKRLIKPTDDSTLKAVGTFLGNLAQDEMNWKLVSFYSKLFDFAHTTKYTILHGTGTRGFSIRVSIQDKGTLSLCTLWKNRTIEFSLKR